MNFAQEPQFTSMLKQGKAQDAYKEPLYESTLGQSGLLACSQATQMMAMPKAPRIKPMMSFSHHTAIQLTSALASDNWCPIEIPRSKRTIPASVFTCSPLFSLLDAESEADSTDIS